MLVSEAVDRRVSVRAFRPDPPPPHLVRQILDKAARAPSGGNLQPWRVYALTGAPLAALLDEVALLVRQQLGKTADELPLACALEGGTWAAGREIALERRPDGAPPLKIESDGTIF